MLLSRCYYKLSKRPFIPFGLELAENLVEFSTKLSKITDGQEFLRCKFSRIFAVKNYSEKMLRQAFKPSSDLFHP